MEWRPCLFCNQRSQNLSQPPEDKDKGNTEDEPEWRHLTFP